MHGRTNSPTKYEYKVGCRRRAPTMPALLYADGARFSTEDGHHQPRHRRAERAVCGRGARLHPCSTCETVVGLVLSILAMKLAKAINPPAAAYAALSGSGTTLGGGSGRAPRSGA